jgi:hypothetical protein
MPDDSLDPYTTFMSEADRALYRQVSAGLDLEGEIKLLRVVLTHLAATLRDDDARVVRVVAALIRLVKTQKSQQSVLTELHRELLEAAEWVLEEAPPGALDAPTGGG